MTLTIIMFYNSSIIMLKKAQGVWDISIEYRKNKKMTIPFNKTYQYAYS